MATKFVRKNPHQSVTPCRWSELIYGSARISHRSICLEILYGYWLPNLVCRTPDQTELHYLSQRSQELTRGQFAWKCPLWLPNLSRRTLTRMFTTHCWDQRSHRGQSGQPEVNLLWNTLWLLATKVGLENLWPERNALLELKVMQQLTRGQFCRNTLYHVWSEEPWPVTHCWDQRSHTGVSRGQSEVNLLWNTLWILATKLGQKNLWPERCALLQSNVVQQL